MATKALGAFNGPIKMEQDADGQIWAYVPGRGPQPVTRQQAEILAEGGGTVGAIGGSIADSLGQIGAGAATLLSPPGGFQDQSRSAFQRYGQANEARGLLNPLASMAGQLVPDVGVGVATGGAGLLPMLGSEAVMGAARSPDDPLQGAALQAGLAGAGPAAFVGGRAALGGLRQLPGLAGGLGQSLQMAGAGMPLGIGARVSARIEAQAARARGMGGSDVGAIGADGGGLGGGVGGVEGAAAAGSGRKYFTGYLDKAEMEARGYQTTLGDNLALGAEDGAQAGYAQRIRAAEELRRSDPVYGASIEAARQQQRAILTQRMAQGIGSTDEVLTPASLGEAFTRLGAEYEAHAAEVGHVQLTPKVYKALDALGEQAHGSYSAWLKKAIQNIKDGADQYGIMDYKDWSASRQELNRGIEAATRQGNGGKLGDAQAAMEILQDAVWRTLPPDARAAFDATNKRYALLKTLSSRQGNIGGDGLVNPLSLAASFGRHPGRYKKSLTDDFMREVDTVRFLGQRQTPSSGTSERLLANPARAIQNAAVPGMAATLGLQAISSLLTG